MDAASAVFLLADTAAYVSAEKTTVAATKDIVSFFIMCTILFK
jgi:hypothetical protein